MRRHMEFQVRRFATMIALLCLAFGLAACYRDPRGSDTTALAERTLGTERDGARKAHALLSEPSPQKLAYDGFVIGLERVDRTRLGDLPALLEYRSMPSDAVMALQHRLDDSPRRMFVSHILRFKAAAPDAAGLPQNGKVELLFNAYAPVETRSKMVATTEPTSARPAAWQEGLNNLRELKPRLGRIIQEQRPTHIILFALEWHANEAEVIRLYNELACKIALAGRADGTNRFRPLLIGLTWPSLTAGFPLESSAIASSNADEAGAIWANILINQVILPASASAASAPKVIAIGHGFGARVLTWGALGAPLLRPIGAVPEARHVSCLIGLQAAVPLADFLSESKPPGPFTNFQPFIGIIAYMLSERDKSFSSLDAGAMLGGIEAWKIAKNYPDQIQRSEITAPGSAIIFEPPIAATGAERVLLLNTTSIVPDHDGIYGNEIGQIIWTLMRGAR